MRDGPTIQTVKRIGTGLSLITFPLMLLLGFLMHPNLLDLNRVTDVTAWSAEFRGNFMFHFGHLLVLLAVPLIIVAGLGCMRLATGGGAWLGLIGGVLGIFGAFVLAVDKGALTLVLTAFDSLSDTEFEAISPALQALLDKKGWLEFVYLLALLPVGFSIMTLGMLRAQAIGRVQAVVIIVGLLLLLNPDIEIISVAAASLMCLGYIPLGIKELRSKSSDVTVGREGK